MIRDLIQLFCSMFPKATHETFASKLFQTFKNHKRFLKPKLSLTDFTISHYAGEVRLFSCLHFTILLLLYGLSSSPNFSIFCRLLIRQIYSWTKTRIMLLLNTRRCWGPQNVHLLPISSLHLRIHQNLLTNSLRLVPGSRFKTYIFYWIISHSMWNKYSHI